MVKARFAGSATALATATIAKVLTQANGAMLCRLRALVRTVGYSTGSAGTTAKVAGVATGHGGGFPFVIVLQIQTAKGLVEEVQNNNKDNVEDSQKNFVLQHVGERVVGVGSAG